MRKSLVFEGIKLTQKQPVYYFCTAQNRSNDDNFLLVKETRVIEFDYLNGNLWFIYKIKIKQVIK